MKGGYIYIRSYIANDTIGYGLVRFGEKPVTIKQEKQKENYDRLKSMFEVKILKMFYGF